MRNSVKVRTLLSAWGLIGLYVSLMALSELEILRYSIVFENLELELEEIFYLYRLV